MPRLRLPPVPPPHQVALSFAVLIAVGTVALRLPAATPPGQAIGWIDALFTATSAACVTGLAVRDTGAGFTPFGQGVILALIQLGGLGIMTLSLAVFTFRGRLSLARLSLVEHTFGGTAGTDIRRLVRTVFVATLATEAVGAVLLALRWRGELGGGRAIWYGLFHAVSAFCNAGFGLWPDSLMRYRGDWPVNLTIGGLIVAGGLGYLVLLELRRTKGRFRPLGVHAKLALATTGLLLGVGTLAFWAVEASRTLAGLPVGEQALASLFQSVTARTAGFNTVDIAALAPTSLLLLLWLMFIGGSPGSCAGGIKTTTAAILLLTTRARLGGRQHVNAFYRTLPARTVQTAFALTSLALLAAVAGLFALLALESSALARGSLDFLDLAFETVSALGTVGLSTATTPELGPASRLVVTCLMFVGRVGPLSLAAVFVGDELPGDWRYPEERVMVG